MSNEQDHQFGCVALAGGDCDCGLEHGWSCLCTPCRVTYARSDEPEKFDRESQRVMSAAWHGFADDVTEALEEPCNENS